MAFKTNERADEKNWLYALPAPLLLVFTTLFWAGNALAGRAMIGEIGPFTAVCLRWTFVSTVLFIFYRRQIISYARQIRFHIVFLFITGLSGYTLFNSFLYLAAQSTEAINLGILQGVIPIFVLIGVALTYGSHLGMLQLLGVFFSLLGVIWVSVRGDIEMLIHFQFHIGDMLMLGGCLCFAAYTLLLQRRPQFSPMVLFATLSAVAAIGSFPLFIFEIISGDFIAPTGKGWAIMAYIILFPSLLSQIFFINGVIRIGPGRAGLFINLVPVFVALLGVVLLKETFQIYHIIAFILVMGGIALSERPWERFYK